MAVATSELVGSDPSEVRVALMRRRHLRGVLRIEQQVYPRPWTIGLYLGELALKTSRLYLVALSGRQVVGYAGVMVPTEDGHITTVAVDPEWHRHKIATRLLLVLCQEAVAMGAENLTLEVRSTNGAAQALYRRFGFAPAGIRPNYYPEVNEDALVMWAHDVHHPAYGDRLDRIAASLPTPLLTEVR
ncbi:MAG: ribosomal protein S18-alanine N-acetyltransferase [Actinomycetota bacterium]|nr:ribosomal protein S18-alanine N-acetyltransferase [Actinomycetota bacterium]